MRSSHDGATESVDGLASRNPRAWAWRCDGPERRAGAEPARSTCRLAIPVIPSPVCLGHFRNRGLSYRFSAKSIDQLQYQVRIKA